MALQYQSRTLGIQTRIRGFHARIRRPTNLQSSSGRFQNSHHFRKRPVTKGIPPPPFSVLVVDLEARFGDSLLVGDFNNDGVQDIAVGSPFAYHEDGSCPLSGKVEVFFLNGTV